MNSPSKNIGRRYHALVVLDVIKRAGERSIYQCRCDCGKVVDLPENTVRKKRSCGCSSGRGKITTCKVGVQPLPTVADLNPLVTTAVDILKKHAPHLLK